MSEVKKNTASTSKLPAKKDEKPAGTKGAEKSSVKDEKTVKSTGSAADKKTSDGKKPQIDKKASKSDLKDKSDAENTDKSLKEPKAVAPPPPVIPSDIQMIATKIIEDLNALCKETSQFLQQNLHLLHTNLEAKAKLTEMNCFNKVQEALFKTSVQAYSSAYTGISTSLMPFTGFLNSKLSKFVHPFALTADAVAKNVKSSEDLIRKAFEGKVREEEAERAKKIQIVTASDLDVEKFEKNLSYSRLETLQKSQVVEKGVPRKVKEGVYQKMFTSVSTLAAQKQAKHEIENEKAFQKYAEGFDFSYQMDINLKGMGNLSTLTN